MPSHDGPGDGADPNPQVLEALAERLLDRYRDERDIQWLDGAITAYRTCLERPDGSARHDVVAVRCADCLCDRAELTADVGDADEAILLCSAARIGVPAGIATHRLARARYVRHQLTGDDADLDAAIDLTGELVAAEWGDLRDHLSVRSSLLRVRFDRTGSRDDLDEAVRAALLLVADTPTADAHRARFLMRAGLVLHTRYGETADPQDLDHAIELGSEASVIAGEDMLPSALSNLATALADRYTAEGRPEDADAALRCARTAVSATPPDHPNLPDRLDNLGGALVARVNRTGDPSDINEAVNVARRAEQETSPRHPDRAKRLANVGTTLHQRWDRTGDLADLQESVRRLDAAVAEGRRTGDPRLPIYRYDGALSRAALATRTRDLAGLSVAIEDLHALLPGAATDRSRFARISSNLSNLLRERFEQTGALADITEAIAAARAAVDRCPDRDPDRWVWLSNLAVALDTSFIHTDDGEHNDEAIEIGRRIVADAPAGHPLLATTVSNLALALEARFGRRGDLADLDDAVAAARMAVEITPVGHTGRPRALTNLCVILLSRAQRLFHDADVDQAVMCAREAVAMVAADDPDRAMHLSNLGSAVRLRFTRRGSGDLDESVDAYAEAVSLTPVDNPDHRLYLNGLAAVLRRRFEHQGPDADLADIDRAIAAGRQVIAACPAGHPSRSLYLYDLSQALGARFDWAGGRDVLDDAIDQGQQSVDATDPVDPNVCSRLTWLARLLAFRHEEHGVAGDGPACLSALATAAATATGPPAVRFHAALAWGGSAAHLDDPEAAAAGFAAAVRLLPLLAWHGLPWDSRQEWIEQGAGAAADAAALALRCGRPEEAVELVEEGRSILWSQILDLRSDVGRLRDAAPQLAAQLDAARGVLDTVETATAPETTPPGTRREGAPTAPFEQRVLVARRFDRLVDEVRDLPGFEHFLRPTPFGELHRAAAEGPVVIVVCSRYGSSALVVTAGTVRGVSLPALSHDEAEERAGQFLEILERAGRRSLPAAVRNADRRDLHLLLKWLWAVVTQDVLAALPVPHDGDSRPPRLWWCPTGPMAVLPLHAAGDAAGTTVHDRVVSSYTPSLRALLRIRDTPASAGQPSLLGVAVTRTENAPDLLHAGEELDFVDARCPLTTRLQTGGGNEPSVARVLRDLFDHRWAHFCCHASNDVTYPPNSALLLADGPLRIAALIERGAARGLEFAYLSACRTASSSLRVSDEALHLAAAMQLLGCRHVVGTLWSIGDATAGAVAQRFYAGLSDGEGGLTLDGAARALHHSVSRLRADYPDEPLVWAPYIHFGP